MIQWKIALVLPLMPIIRLSRSFYMHAVDMYIVIFSNRLHTTQPIWQLFSYTAETQAPRESIGMYGCLALLKKIGFLFWEILLFDFECNTPFDRHEPVCLIENKVINVKSYQCFCNSKVLDAHCTVAWTCVQWKP